MVDNSSDDRMDGKVYVVYERIGALQWLLPGESAGEDMRWCKHWRLVIQLGFDWFTLEFVENSLLSLQGVVMAGSFDPEAASDAILYHVGDLKEMSTMVLYRWIKDEFRSKVPYNVLVNNCQHFVLRFLSEFEGAGYFTKTGHLEVPKNRLQWPSLEGGNVVSSYMPGWETLLDLQAAGLVIGTMNHLFKSNSTK